MGAWEVKRLSDVVDLRRGMDLPHRDRRPGPFPVVSAGELSGWHDVGPVTGPGFVIGRATNLGIPTWSETDFWPLNTTLYAADFKGNDPRYLFHLFESTDLSGFDSGSVQPMLNRNYIAGIEVFIAPKPEQRAIVEVLRSIDDRVLQNERTIDAAERYLLAVASTVAERVPLARLAVQRKSAVATDGFAEVVAHFSLPAFDRGAMPDVVEGTSIKSNKTLIDRPLVLVSKLNPRIPRVWNVPSAPEVMGLASTEFVALEPFAVTTTALWAALRQPSVTADLAGLVAGTTGSHQRVKPTDVLNTEVPDVSMLSEAVAEEVGALGNLMTSLRTQSAGLGQAREELLPLLMSGRLRVKDAERTIGEVL